MHRQIDGALAAPDALPAIVARVGDRAEVLLDVGVRRGTDVIKALCLGRRGVHRTASGVTAWAPGARRRRAHRQHFPGEIMTTMTLKELDSSWLLPADTPITG